MHVCVYDCVCSPSPLFLQHTLFRPLPLVAGIKRVIFTVVLYKQCFELPCSKVFPHLGYLFNYIWYLFINDVIVIIYTQINHSIKEVCYKLLSKSTKTEFCGWNRLATKMLYIRYWKPIKYELTYLIAPLVIWLGNGAWCLLR